MSLKLVNLKNHTNTAFTRSETVHAGKEIVSIYPYRAHTAKEPVGDGPRGRCYGPKDPELTV